MAAAAAPAAHDALQQALHITSSPSSARFHQLAGCSLSSSNAWALLLPPERINNIICNLSTYERVCVCVCVCARPHSRRCQVIYMALRSAALNSSVPSGKTWVGANLPRLLRGALAAFLLPVLLGAAAGLAACSMVQRVCDQVPM